MGWLLWPLSACADGKVFSQVTAVKTTTPDQRALLHFANGTETLVVETTFVGTGTNFAWVVPLPAAPEITAVPRTLFTNLEALFRPEIIHKQAHWWALMVGLAVFFVTLFRKAGQRGGIRGWLLLTGALSLMILVALPGLVKSRGALGISIEQIGVQILARQTVGVFDTVTLSSPDGAALTRWLNEHGFAVPAAAAPVIADYAKQGWVFAAAKLSRPDATGKTSPHPLAFKFKTDRAVYPLRLTGVENDRCLVELYVFGESRAELPGFKVEQCFERDFAEEIASEGKHAWGIDWRVVREPAPGELRIRHPGLRSLVAGATVGTKLIGTLDAAGMSHDSYPTWVSFERQLASYYSREAAGTRAMNLGVAVLILTLPCVGFWLWRSDGKWTPRLFAQVLGCAIAAGMACYGALPKVKVEVRRDRYVRLSWRASQFNQLQFRLSELAQDLHAVTVRGSLPELWTLPDLGSAFEDEVGLEERKQLMTNLLTGEPLREEATPGNLLFRRTDAGTEVLWHDVDCVEHILGTLPTRAP